MDQDHEQLEQDVLEAVMTGRWESPWAEPLRAHAAGCASCADLVLVAEALQHERHRAAAEAKPPSASLVWWKAQLRARREAAERAVRPVAIAERAGLAAALIAVFVAAMWAWPQFAGWLGPARDQLPQWQAYAGFFSTFFTASFAVAFAIGTGLLCLMALALYAVFARD